FRLLAARLHQRHPIFLKDTLAVAAVYDRRGEDGDAHRAPLQPDFLQTLLTAATNIGSLLCVGIGDAILVQGEPAPGQAMRLSYNILQASVSRIFKTV